MWKEPEGAARGVPRGGRELRGARGVDLSEAAGNALIPYPSPASGEGRTVAGRRSLPGQTSAGATALRERQIHILNRFVDLRRILVAHCHAIHACVPECKPHCRLAVLTRRE